MIAGPTTEKILLDCARELMEGVLPAVDDDTAKVRVFMLENVLRNAAVRAAHEVAWMREETAELVAYARSVLSAGSSAPALARALEETDQSPSDSLHLDDVVDTYRRASEALSCAVEAAMAAGDEERTEAGVALLESRIRRERIVLSGWGELAGR